MIHEIKLDTPIKIEGEKKLFKLVKTDIEAGRFNCDKKIKYYKFFIKRLTLTETINILDKEKLLK